MKNLFSALANSNRLRIVRILLRGPLNVSEISDILGLNQSNVSHSLRKLLDAGIVLHRGRGSWVYYRLNRQRPEVEIILDALAKGTREIENYENDMSGLIHCYDRRRSEAREFFDRVASELDEVSYLMPDPEDYMEDVIKMYSPGSTILDAGCGSGELLLRLAGKGVNVIGVDQSREMLSRAGKRIASEHEASNAELRLGSAEHLPVADSSVDGIIAHMLLHHLGFFKEAARVCRNEGSCCVIELVPHENSDMKRMQGDLWPGLDKVEVTNWMISAGFSGIEETVTNDDRVFMIKSVLRERNTDE